MSIYNLHIPRTAGIYLNNNVLPHLVSNRIEHFASNRSIVDPSKLEKSQFVSGHFGTSPIQYMDSPDVFCILRNPVDRFISYFHYTTGVIKTRSEVYQKLDRWLYGEQAEVQSNLQSKFLTGGMNFEEFNKGVNYFQSAVDNGWYIENYSLDIKDIIKAADSYNMYTLETHDLFKEDMNKALESHFGFTTFKKDYKANSSDHSGVEFTESQIKRIQELNYLDMEVYEYVQKNQKRY